MATNPLEPGHPHEQPLENSRHGRLAFRLREPVTPSEERGLLDLEGRDGEQAGLAYVPEARADEGLRLVLLLHGAGGAPRQAVELLRPVAEQHGLLLVAPKSRAATWDVIVHGYGPDIRLADRLLDNLAARFRVVSLSVAGFSDGASYALSLGIANGDVFDSVIAFSPGFVAALVEHGRPRIFVSHGTEDRVLPVDRCSRRLVPQLRKAGYDVTYREFEGGHTVPRAITEDAGGWLEEPSG